MKPSAQVQFSAHLLPIVFVSSFLLFSFVDLGSSSPTKSGLEPSFAEPVKNFSVDAGSNIVFSCNVRSLGGIRVIWLKLDDGKSNVMAINNLKVTSNPRVSVSLLPEAGDVTQIILYINEVEPTDSGDYHCIVYTTPNIVQIGTLEVKLVPTEPTTAIPSSTPTTTTTTTEPVQSSSSSEETLSETTDIADDETYWLRMHMNVQYLFTMVFSSVKSIF